MVFTNGKDKEFLLRLDKSHRQLVFDRYRSYIIENCSAKNMYSCFLQFFNLGFSIIIGALTFILLKDIKFYFKLLYCLPAIIINCYGLYVWFNCKVKDFLYLKDNLLNTTIRRFSYIFTTLEFLYVICYFAINKTAVEATSSLFIAKLLIVLVIFFVGTINLDKRFINHLLYNKCINRYLDIITLALGAVGLFLWLFTEALTVLFFVTLMILVCISYAFAYNLYFYINYNLIKYLIQR